MAYTNRVATHLKIREFKQKSEQKLFDEKVREIQEKLSNVREKSNCLANALENVYITHLIPYFVKE